MNFIGEHLLPGQLGHFFLLLSLVASIGATVSYFLSVQKSAFYNHAGNALKGTGSLTINTAWRKLARIFFITEAISVLAVFVTLFYIISNHLFEYKYAWQHSSLSLEMKYLLSCFWEGQEGSFLLWSIWHCVLGLVIIWREKEWEGPVMTVISFAQFCLATMLLGVSFFGLKSGSNPFILLRNSGVLDNAPVFYGADGLMRQDYLSLIKDGNDLNPLLQNYWMVIHPPVLFLGFASTIVPFAFAIGGLWTKRFTEWTKAALPWALFSAGILGLGIMMGAAWAYESLNFGGYWAWDPVENASLVPWMVLVAGVHTLLIYRHTGNALRTTNLFFILAFVLVLYSTYLTRSGDLQETSVHAFTGEGITKWHLRGLLLIFLLPSFTLFFNRYKRIPFIAKEEEGSSREFWMFIGSLVLFLSAIVIIAMTSVPVFNKIAGLFTGNDKTFKAFAVGEDAAFAYNRIQIFVAIIIGCLTAIGMYLKYKTTGKPFFKKMIVPAIIGLVAGGLVLAFGNIDYREHGIGYLGAIWLALVASVYSLIANGSYIFTGQKGVLKKAGGAIAHVGFAMMLTGILISSSKKEVISHNTTGIFLNFGEGSKEKPGENLTLIKGVPTKMGEFTVTYDKDSAHPKKPLWYYHLKFEKDGKESFSLAPNAFVNYKGNEGLMANPDAKHYLTHDIFTYITSLPDPSKANEDTTSFKSREVAVGDTVFYSKGFAVLEDVSSIKSIPGVEFGANDSASVATIKVISKTSSIFTVKPTVINLKGTVFAQPDTVLQESLVMQLQKVNGKKITLGVKESDAIMQYVTLKAYKFPYINLLWLGTLIMVLGFMISMAWRIQSNRKKPGSKEKGVKKAGVQEQAFEV
ncbi:MAG TPA: cytochrome c biogenesis protein CcsA [Flavisolibacter sp.]|nr:cytochrome c biogenesis protein CcsA [Flavisolibacter sp.]